MEPSRGREKEHDRDRPLITTLLWASTVHIGIALSAFVRNTLTSAFSSLPKVISPISSRNAFSLGASDCKTL